MNFFLLIAALVVAHAKAQRPTKVTICYPIAGSTSTFATATVWSTDLPNYAGYTKGACAKNCKTLCAEFPSSIVNATTGLCSCIGTALKCGANAKISNDRKSCV
jgi:hypothetical protein